MKYAIFSLLLLMCTEVLAIDCETSKQLLQPAYNNIRQYNLKEISLTSSQFYEKKNLIKYIVDIVKDECPLLGNYWTQANQVIFRGSTSEGRRLFDGGYSVFNSGVSTRINTNDIGLRSSFSSFQSRISELSTQVDSTQPLFIVTRGDNGNLTLVNVAADGEQVSVTTTPTSIRNAELDKLNSNTPLTQQEKPLTSLP